MARGSRKKAKPRTMRLWINTRALEYETFKDKTGIVSVMVFAGRRQPLPWYERATLTLDPPAAPRKPRP